MEPDRRARAQSVPRARETLVQPGLEPLRARALDDPGKRQLAAWLQLQATLGLRPALAWGLLRLHGDPAAALRASAAAPVLSRAALARSIETLASSGIAAVPVLSPAYPERLRDLVDPAPLLLVQGDPAAACARSVAIVGARSATAYGRWVARDLARRLAEAGVVVVSGLARGIDSEAHRGALEGGGRTVAVQACGPDQVYPREHRGLAHEIAAHGAVLCELPPGAPPLRPHFPLRNRLIARMAEIVVVVEARAASGSLITARHALDQGGEVMAVPGPVSSPTSEGTNRLLRDGSAPVLDASDVLDRLWWPSVSLPRADPARLEPARDATLEPARDATLEPARDATLELARDATLELARDAAAVLTALADAPASRDELCRNLGASPPDLAQALLPLELEGHVHEDRDGRLHLAPEVLAALRKG